MFLSSNAFHRAVCPEWCKSDSCASGDRTRVSWVPEAARHGALDGAEPVVYAEPAACVFPIAASNRTRSCQARQSARLRTDCPRQIFVPDAPSGAWTVAPWWGPHRRRTPANSSLPSSDVLSCDEHCHLGGTLFESTASSGARWQAGRRNDLRATSDRRAVNGLHV